uniref:Protein phosphatase 1 regulatory subunit 7 n=1 Tax=Globisporangium ultimum (strain ATCC 200006 / CBS 805.95 / DAOM BR144) TaxID=431595 RepID=K3WHM8_GLOUD
MENASAKRKVNFGKNVVHPSSLHLGGAASDARSVSLTSNSSSGGGGTNQGSAADGKRQRANAPKTLDGFMFLDCCRVEFPDELSQAVLSGLRINNVVAEDLLFFSNLTRLDMSDNEAQLEPFGCLPALIELDFQCNAVQNLSITNGFLSLEVLNLSFNCLTSKDVEELSNLLRIRELYLSNNWVQSLPPIMDRFSRLETLSLEQNNIVGEEIFTFLSIVPRLRSLNLSHNKITGFPESALILEEKRGAGFYNLLYLNLAHNSISTEEAVVFTCELYSLRKLVLYGNPLVHAAVMSHDQTKLAYDPVPTMSTHIAERGLSLELLLAYPETKRKKRTAMSSYENVEIYKMIPNELPLQQPFRTKATNYLLAESDTKRERPDIQTTGKPTIRQISIDTSDTTFLTGVGIEDVFGNAMASRSSSEIPAVPASMITRSLAMSHNAQPIKARSAINALRYQLSHPLTSHDNSELFPTNSQRPTLAHLQRQRPRHPSDERLSLYESSFPSVGISSGSNSSIHYKHKGSRGVDDALAELSEQVSSKNWEKRANGERNVDLAMDSLMATAQKINLAYQHPR